MKKLTLFCLFVLMNFAAIYPLEWENFLRETLESRSVDSLTIFYERWAVDYESVDSITLSTYNQSIQESYSLYPKVANIFDKHHYGNHLFWLIHDKLRIEISDTTISYSEFISRQKQISVDSLRKDKKLYLRYDYLGNDGLGKFCKQISNKFTIYNFQPNLQRPNTKYISNLSELSILPDLLLSSYEIEKSLLKTGLTIYEINKSYNSSIIYWTKRSTERKHRLRFLASQRFNLKDRIIRIIFQKDFQKAVVITGNINDTQCCKKTFYLFEKINKKWQEGIIIQEENNSCSDHQGCEIL